MRQSTKKIIALTIVGIMVVSSFLTIVTAGFLFVDYSLCEVLSIITLPCCYT